MFRRLALATPLPSILERFGIRGREQLGRDLRALLRRIGAGASFDLGSAGLLRPDLSLPAYAGLLPRDGLSPVFNFFDRNRGGQDFRTVVSRSPSLRDWRGGRLSYDEHDGTDFVCPPGTPLCAAAPGVVVAIRDQWLRGGLTACVDHGAGVVTQYTHLTRVTAEVGQPVRRGEPIALAGTSGVDMTMFFPWVPPHVHFMVWVAGRPVDPFLAPDDDPRRPGLWVHGNEPRTVAEPLAGDEPPPREVPTEGAAIARVLAMCRETRIREEIERAPSDAARVAILEDSLHHQRAAWPAEARGVRLRPEADASRVRITLPLPAELYRGAAAADTPWTRAN